MKLKELRESKGYTRKELSEMTGINLRSLQDYEQGHKNILSMKGESLYRLSLALDCAMEDILNDYVEVQVFSQEGNHRIEQCARRLIAYGQIFCEKYNVSGHWVPKEEHCDLVFEYRGEKVALPLHAEFTKDTLVWVNEAGKMMIEDYYEDKAFEEQAFKMGGALKDEW